MKFPVSTASSLIAASAFVLLSACGGGGGDSSNGNNTSVAASTITFANSTDVAAQSYSASGALNDQASGSTSLVTGVSVETTSTGFLDATIRHLYRALDVKPATMVVGVSSSATEACTGGGTVTVAVEATRADMLSNGDTMKITANNCTEDGLKIHGVASIVFSNLTGTPSEFSAWGATMAMTFTDFAVTENNVTETAKGDMTLVYSRTSAGAENFSAAGKSFRLTTAEGSSTVVRTFSDYTYAGSATSSNLYTYRANFTLVGNLPKLGSNVMYTVKTTKDFKQNGTGNPSEGVMTVTATDKSSLTLTVLDSSNVQIGIDRNGDGTVDETTTKTWAQISSLL